MRICWHSTAPWSASGYGTQTAIWVKKLTQMGHEVLISAYWGLSGSATQWEGITVLPGFGANYCSTSLHQHYKAMQPDLVITLGDVWVLDATLLRQMPAAHWLPADCRPMSTADRQVVEASGAQLIAMSQFGYDRFRTAGFRPVLWPHGIDTHVFQPPADREKVRDALGIAPEDYVIGINGANNDAIRKGLPEQMLAFAKFHRNHPEALLALHTGIHQDGGQDLEAVAADLGITDRVRVVDQYRYHAGLIQPADLAEWYASMDVLSACAYGEGFGLPVMEAQSCGTPVITTRASAMEELNPLGQQVDGEPFWNGVHRAWWIRPSITQIADAYEQAWEQQDNIDRDALREFALGYDAEVIAERYAAPALEELRTRFS